MPPDLAAVVEAAQREAVGAAQFEAVEAARYALVEAAEVAAAGVAALAGEPARGAEAVEVAAAVVRPVGSGLPWAGSQSADSQEYGSAIRRVSAGLGPFRLHPQPLVLAGIHRVIATGTRLARAVWGRAKMHFLTS